MQTKEDIPIDPIHVMMEEGQAHLTMEAKTQG